MSTQWTVADIPPQQGRRIVVTGASSGLGLETSVALAAAGAEVIMACRNPDRAGAALDQVQRRAPGAKAELMTLDLADLASVRTFAADCARRFERIDVLCNNAGVMALPLQRTKDGFEMQMGTNHLGHFALTGLMLDQLKATAGARVVSVASNAHKWGMRLDAGDLGFERQRYNKWDAYGRSKMANLRFHFELDRRLRAAGFDVRSACAHPGYAATNLMFVGPAQQNSRVGRLLMQFGNALLSQDQAMGALPQLYAITMPDVESGDYFGPDGWQQLKGHPRRVGCLRIARDPERNRLLWEASERLTGVRYL
ncbi:oxidoreductase [Sinimarinibacterium flocculans]|uniref:NAD(P)-dependent dehydrogenase (Short-subunit alcohol dehydrogenase family) n=1 Tax=Sinimarinibacterium flocculans TaxID=985250 RepID=A0A318EF04_9GAMM|nr:oxidoreductase [Sinimarinibacterium flocculans]PXV71379.1 NAD(P)-dependent dehydrogenase (short-subunit alcohol dehydrogenase family) [Sinimarinibacterium flocculans]